MSITARVLTFGIISGLVWSLALFIFGGFSSVSETVKVLASGILSGILVSFALKTPLSKFGWFGVFVAGLISLPLGAFSFGFFEAVLEIVVGVITGGTHDFNPFLIGSSFAAMSVANLFALIFFPLAILTTFILRVVIRADRRLES